MPGSTWLGFAARPWRDLARHAWQRVLRFSPMFPISLELIFWLENPRKCDPAFLARHFFEARQAQTLDPRPHASRLCIQYIYIDILV